MLLPHISLILLGRCFHGYTSFPKHYYHFGPTGAGLFPQKRISPHAYCGWAYGGRVLKRKKISGVPAANAKAPPIKKVALDCLDLAAVKGYPSFLISNIIFIPRFLQIHGTTHRSVPLAPSFYVKHRSAMIRPFMTAFIRRLQLLIGAIFPMLQRLGVLLRSLDSPFL